MDATPPRITGPTLKVLNELIARPLHGLSGSEISRSTGLASGTLYPLLFRLENSGWLESQWEEVDPHAVKRPRKRFYRLTPLGESAVRSVFREYLPKAGELAWQ